MSKWAVVIENLEAKKMQLVTPEIESAGDDARYGNEVHVCPVVFDGDDISFGFHEFTRDCPCHPKVKQGISKTVIIHTEKVN